MRLIPLLILTLGLAGCGADGAPTAPVAKTDGVSITGEGRVGITTTN